MCDLSQPDRASRAAGGPLGRTPRSWTPALPETPWPTAKPPRSTGSSGSGRHPRPRPELALCPSPTSSPGAARVPTPSFCAEGPGKQAGVPGVRGCGRGPHSPGPPPGLGGGFGTGGRGCRSRSCEQLRPTCSTETNSFPRMESRKGLNWEK